jgi:uncharacterized protein YrrD
MQRVSEIVGKPVVSAQDGEKVGEVVDLLVDANASHIVGLIIGGGVFTSEQVLPFAEVQALGKDAVVARSRKGVLGRRPWRDLGIEASRSSTLRNRRVMTTNGRELGTIRDVCVDEATGAIEAYELGRDGLAGLLGRRSLLPRAGAVTVGPDAVIVSDEVARVLDTKGHP